MNNELSHLAEHVVSVVPHGVEAQHFAVHFDELLEFVKVRDSLVYVRGSGLTSFLRVRILGHLVVRHGRVHLDTLTLQEVLHNIHSEKVNIGKQNILSLPIDSWSLC